jgi:hypothetical protein
MAHLSVCWRQAASFVCDGWDFFIDLIDWLASHAFWQTNRKAWPVRHTAQQPIINLKEKLAATAPPPLMVHTSRQVSRFFSIPF